MRSATWPATWVAAVALASCTSRREREPEPAKPAQIAGAVPTSSAAAAWSKRLFDLRADLLNGKFEIADENVPLAALLPAGRPAVFAFFATYCPPCIEEMPMFAALQREGHAIRGVSMDAGNVDELRALLARERVDYPIAVLREDAMKAAGRALDGLPMTLIVDGAGLAREAIAGKTTRAQVIAALERARLK